MLALFATHCSSASRATFSEVESGVIDLLAAVDPADQDVQLIPSPDWTSALILRDGHRESLLVDPAEGRALRRITTARPPSGAAFSPDGGWLALTIPGSAEPRRRPLVSAVQPSSPATSVSFRTDRRRQFDDSGAARPRAPFYSPRALFSPSGEAIITGPHGARRGCEHPFEVHATGSWRRQGWICAPSASVELALAPRGSLVASGTSRTLLLHNPARPLRPRRVAGVESVTGLLFSPDVRWLAVESWEEVGLVDVVTGRERITCPLRRRNSRAHPEARDLVADPQLPHFDIPVPLAFSPDGRYFAAAAEQLYIFSLDGVPQRSMAELAFPAEVLVLSDDEAALLLRFVSGYVLAVVDLATGACRYSRAVPFLHPGRPTHSADTGWQVCGLTCADPEVISLRCGREDLPLLNGGCALECPGQLEWRCAQPELDALLPELRRIENETRSDRLRDRAVRWIERLRNSEVDEQR